MTPFAHRLCFSLRCTGSNNSQRSESLLSAAQKKHFPMRVSKQHDPIRPICQDCIHNAPMCNTLYIKGGGIGSCVCWYLVMQASSQHSWCVTLYDICSLLLEENLGSALSRCEPQPVQWLMPPNLFRCQAGSGAVVSFLKVPRYVLTWLAWSFLSTPTSYPGNSW